MACTLPPESTAFDLLAIFLAFARANEKRAETENQKLYWHIQVRRGTKFLSLPHAQHCTTAKVRRTRLLIKHYSQLSLLH